MIPVTGYCGTPAPFERLQIDIDGYEDDKGITYWGKATLQPDGRWTALAVIHGIVCAVEVTIREKQATT